MHFATIFIRGFLNIIEGLFAIGLIGSTVVLILSIIEDVKTVLS